MKKDRDMRQTNCCKCYWNDQCCSGCNAKQEDCDDFTPLFTDGVDELDYIEQGYLKDLALESEQGDMCEWSDCITEAWLSGNDITEDEWWSAADGKGDVR